MAKRKRVLSGMRPTGRMHIGNYFGALANWIKLQEDRANDYDCYFFVADWHSLTSDYADTSQIAQNTIEIAIDFLAGGLDPKKVTIFQQSQVPEHAELHLLLSMITPLGWLERVPTYKEQLENIKDKDLHTYGFLGYPVLQTADIVMYGEEGAPLIVPVGEDQVAHVELSREIVATFNSFFGFQVEYERWREKDREGLIRALYPRSGQPIRTLTGMNSEAHRTAPQINRDVLRRQLREEGPVNFAKRIGAEGMQYFHLTPLLCEPEVLLTQTPRVPGLDGRKMSKSYNNTILLSESDESIRAKTKVMVTDPARKRRQDPGNPDVCPVYDWHKLFSPPETLAWSNHGCRTAEIGCIECKAAMADNLIQWITPIRARREQYEKQPEQVLKILDTGSKKAREVARATMVRVREAVFGWEKTRAGHARHGGPAAETKNVKAGR